MENNNWIFLRGLTRGKGHWGYFPEHFQKRVPHARIEFIDLPGNGDRFAETSPLCMQDYVYDLKNKSEFVKKSKVNILSISLGSMIAVAWQNQFPEDIDRTVLINTSYRGIAPWKRFNLRALKTFAQVPFARSAWVKEDLISQVVCNNEENRKSSLPLLVEQTSRSPFQGQNFFRQLYAAARADFPDRPKTEITLLASEMDRLVSPECTKKIGQLWNISPSIHPTAGHDLPIDDPKWVLDHIFL